MKNKSKKGKRLKRNLSLLQTISFLNAAALGFAVTK